MPAIRWSCLSDFFSYENQCVAAVVPSSGSGGTSFVERRLLMKQFNWQLVSLYKGWGQECHVVYTACSAPEYVRK